MDRELISEPVDADLEDYTREGAAPGLASCFEMPLGVQDGRAGCIALRLPAPISCSAGDRGRALGVVTRLAQ